MHDGQVVLRRERAHHALRQIEHGPDLRHAGPVEVRHRLEAADPPLEQQTHQERLDGVVIVVAERHLGKALLQQRLIQRPAAHLGAQRAGIVFLPVLEDDRPDLRLHAGIRHAEALTQACDRREIHAAEAHVDRDGREVIGIGHIFPQRRQKRQQRQRILAAGHADGDAVARLDHPVILDAAAHESHHSLHANSSVFSKNCPLSICEYPGEKRSIREFFRRKMKFPNFVLDSRFFLWYKE